MEDLFPDRAYLLKMASAMMPFGRYAGLLLVDLPEPYLVWMRQNGFPGGELGEILQCIYEVKVNGLEFLFDPLRQV